MKWILSRESIEVVEQFAWSKVLVALDFDGTLAPIVGDRDQAFMRRETHVLLDKLAQVYPLVIISGRSREDVSARLGGISVRQVVGNHGLEPTETMDSFEEDTRHILPQLREALGGFFGVDIEDKRYSLAVHYRRSRAKQATRVAIQNAIEKLDRPMRIVLGKLVVNAIPDRAPHKGDALIALRRREGMDTALYVGDDVTDEDVFELDQPGRLLSIRVGHSRRSAAPYYLRDQNEMDQLLRTLIAFRTKSPLP